MSKGNIIIIEDEFFAAEHLSDLVKSFGFTVVGIYHSGERFLKETDWNFDAAILDIFLSEKLTGLDLAVQLNEKQKPFVFLTANQDSSTLKKAAQLSPVSYLSKPFKTNDVEVALEIIALKISVTKAITIKTPKGKIKVLFDDILYIEADNVYSKIITKSKIYTERATLKTMEKVLDNNFIRVHRSYIVNKTKITSQKATVIYINEIEIPYSRSYKNNF